MGLKLLTENGNMLWHCHNGCPPLEAHFSHEQCEFLHDGSVVLPPCPKCGSRMAVRTVRFDDEPNAVDREGSLTETHHMLERHAKLATMMKDAGKVVPPPPRELVILSHTVEKLPDGAERITIVHQPGAN